MLPKNPNMLLSYINMGLRDKYDDLADMAASEGFNKEDIIGKLDDAGFIYDEAANKFISK